MIVGELDALLPQTVKIRHKLGDELIRVVHTFRKTLGNRISSTRKNSNIRLAALGCRGGGARLRDRPAYQSGSFQFGEISA